MLARSYLFAPGDNEKLLRKALIAGADAVVFDLEDAVAPANKPAARKLIQQVLSELPDESSLIYVRINALSSSYWQDDLVCALNSRVTGLRIGKAESFAEVQTLDEALRQMNAPVALHFVPTIESALGVMNAAEMARHPRVAAFSFGAENDADETATLYARSQLVVVSRAAGLHPPIASVFTQLKDLDGLRVSTLAQRRLGFFGRSCIHPTQLAVIHEAFTPTPEQLEEARAIVAAVADGQATATLSSGQFIDAPIVERARQLILRSADFSL
jgi:citrate lyase subunit beta / citryl-CoA lyase